ncbi:SurA N-terminal domain-containing protein [Ornithinibacillus contaminans]|uniref:SurA N-terminal domain-containing protein n=1 Tax=Ornithinibacillus contaminans TaxID=694055 RepID=UPI00064DF5F4|nr:SurA N-terminal domain-containing protein [Ornithinibacillus contaminans]
MKKLFSLLMILGLIVVLAACGDDKEEESKKDKEEEAAPTEITMNEDEKVENDKVVVRINDTEITGERYNTVYLQTKMRVYQFGQDIEDKDNIKEVTLNEIIAQELIKQEADKQGVEVTDEEVQTEFDKLKSENEESFASYLEQYNLTEETLKDQIRFSTTLEKYMADHIETEEVTDDDIKETYDQLKEEMDDMMAFEEAEPLIKEQLAQQREADALQAKVEALMKESEIEKLI